MKPWLPAVALFACAAAAEAQVRVTITDVGPGASGPLLREALRRPHRLAEPDSARLVITREVQVRGSLIVLGRNALVEGSVDGDVIVVGGDVFVRAGARIGGRLVAIGGGAYPSALAVVAGGTQTFRESTFDIARDGDGYRLTYRSTAPPTEAPLLFPLFYGFRVPLYDRVNGLSVPFGPALPLGRDGGRIDLLATWRSNLGVIDPALHASYQLTRRTRATLDAQRGSFTNDNWIWLDWVNSMSMLVFGDDTRNFYRASRAELSLFRLWEGERIRWEPSIGVAFEDASSVGSGVAATGGPWSMFGRTDTLAARRANPAIVPGVTTSAILGASMHWESDGVRIDARTRLELPLSTPTSATWQQATTDAMVAFPTFGEQEYAVDVHWVATLGDTPPPQRFAYVGGSGTLPFDEMLSQGGDQLLLIDQRYSIPLTRIRFGYLGVPSLQLRHRIAAAGADSLPSLDTMLGFGLAVVVFRGEVQVNPATGKARLSAGFTFSR